MDATACELFTAIVLLWIVGLGGTMVVGLAAAYVRLTKRLLLAPVRLLFRAVRRIAKSIGGGAARMARAIVAAVARQVFDWLRRW